MNIKKLLPRISETERAALDCGTVSADGEIFNGSIPTIKPATYEDLTPREKDFLDNKVATLIALQDEFGYFNHDLHPEVWHYLKEEKFFALNIPQVYGGLEFSPLLNSLVVTAISSSGYISLAVTVMVPNSLGPAELLMHYGTKEQQLRYLPRLAEGAIPCFALTGPRNGSDATGQMDVAYPIEDDGYHVALDKRYITLAPVADLIGLAVNVAGKGITVFLIERDHPGLEIGDRHNPLEQPFMNGPIRGTIRLTDDNILGGPKYLGKGWNMLVDCLTVGRAISLPGLSTGTAIMSDIGSMAYAKSRKQFGTEIYNFEGIQEKLLNIVYQRELLDKTQDAINGELLRGEKPAVLSSMWKYQSTSRSRSVINDAMDILGGNGIQLGDNNWLGETYMSMPIAITVEGANVLTRSLMTFGQGLMRAHPHVRPMVDSGNTGRTMEFLGHAMKLVGHATTNFTKGFFGSKAGLFAFTADMCLTLGKKYKTSERLSGAMADIFSIRYMSALQLRDTTRVLLKNEERAAYKIVIKELPLLAKIPMKILFHINFPTETTLSAKEIKKYIGDSACISPGKFVQTEAISQYMKGESYVEVDDSGTYSRN